MLGNLHDGVKHVKAIGHTAAGTDGSAVLSNAIATAGFGRARVCIELGTVTNNGVLKAAIKGCSTSGGSYVALVDLGDDGFVATSKSEKCVVLDCPVEIGAEFIKVEYQRVTANIELDAITVDLYDADVVPANAGDVCKSAAV